MIGCPCALVISTPVSIVASLASAAKAGVLVKGGTFIEVPSKLRALALDKTGTLTVGAPKVVDVQPMADHSEQELLRAMGAIEAHSDHPLARAIVAEVQSRGIRFPAAGEVQAVQGRGVTATVEEKRYWLGSHRYLEELGQQTPELQERLNTMTSAGRTVVVVGTDDHVCGFITLADVLTFAGYASLWAAIAGDMGVSLVVIANPLRRLQPK